MVSLSHFAMRLFLTRYGKDFNSETTFKDSKYLINEILLLKPYQSSIRVYNLRKFSFPYFQNGQLKLDEDSWMGYATKFFTSDDPNDPSKYYFGMH